MHQTREKSSIKLPIRRKGTKYIARASSFSNESVPVVIAVRDMLHLARNAKEVKAMIKLKSLKLNGKPVKDYRESIRLFNIFEADKPYALTLLPSGKFTLEQSKAKDRLCKVLDKRLLSKGRIQLNLHDGTNIISSDKIKVGDSIYLSSENKIVKHVSYEKAKPCFIISGKYSGQEGKIESIENNKSIIKLEGKENKVGLNKSNIIVK